MPQLSHSQTASSSGRVTGRVPRDDATDSTRAARTAGTMPVWHRGQAGAFGAEIVRRRFPPGVTFIAMVLVNAAQPPVQQKRHTH